MQVYFSEAIVLRGNLVPNILFVLMIIMLELYNLPQLDRLSPLFFPPNTRSPRSARFHVFTDIIYQNQFRPLHCLRIFMCGSPSGNIIVPWLTATTHWRHTSKLLQSPHQRPWNVPVTWTGVTHEVSMSPLSVGKER